MGDRPPVRGSVFIKLLAIMVTLAASLLGLVAFFFWLVVTPTLNSSVSRLGEAYARLVAAHGPDRDEARRLAADGGVAIRYEGPRGAWTTSERLPSIDDIRRRHSSGWVSWLAFPVFHLAPAPDGGAYLVAWSVASGMQAAHRALLVVLLGLMLAVFVTTHVVLRRLLHPLRALDHGVAQLASGELDVVLPVTTRDEFGALTRAFNDMARRVAGMVRARDQLLLDVSHELRSPLTRMKVALELVPDDVERRSMAADIAEMEAMIAELLELERLRDGGGIKTAPWDLVAIVRDVAAAFRETPPGVRVRADDRDVPLAGAGPPGAPDPLPEIVAAVDAERLRIALRNLLDNAAKYALPDSGPVRVSITRTGGQAIVRVSDDGPGIPAADFGSIFDPFYRVDRSRSRRTGGYGLGLSIVKRIVEAHGGAVTVAPHVPRGVTFEMTLPLEGTAVASAHPRR